VKKKASPETVRKFLEAVYPEYTELAIATNSEESCLRDATELIQEQRKLIEAVGKLLLLGEVQKAITELRISLR